MNIRYKILEVVAEDHTIIVRYWTDKLSELFLASIPEMRPDGSPVRCRSDVSILLPIPEPDEEELRRLILRHAPIDGLKAIEQVLDPEVDTSMNVAQALKAQEFEISEEKAKAIIAGIPTDDDIEAAIAALASSS